MQLPQTFIFGLDKFEIHRVPKLSIVGQQAPSLAPQRPSQAMSRTTPYNWISGEGPRQSSDINPRGWAQVNFGNPFDGVCVGYDHGCPCQVCQEAFRNDIRPVPTKLHARHEARIEYLKGSLWLPGSALNKTTPICCSRPISGLPPRIMQLSDLFDAVTSHAADLPSAGWLEHFASSLKNNSSNEEWEGRLIWAAVSRADFLAFASPWDVVGSRLRQNIPSSQYPSHERAGIRAPFIDVGLGSSIGFFWILSLDWDIQFSAAIATSIAYWADMASGVDAPAGQLAEIFDVMPSLAHACATGQHDNLSPMKALAVEYLRTESVQALPGIAPSVRDVWLSRLADVGARESCVLMTSCQAAFSNRRSAEDTRCLVAWSVIHDLYDFPRDLASGNRVNAVFWALFAGFSGREVAAWLRESVNIAARSSSCAAKLLLCTAFVHITNPRWSVNGLALSESHQWPIPPQARPRTEDTLPLFGDHIQGSLESGKGPVCLCTSTQVSRTLGLAVLYALNGCVNGFASASDRLEAHNTGMTALLAQDWDTQVELSRMAWSSFLNDLDAIAAWVDGI